LTVHSRKIDSPAMSMLGLDSPIESEHSADVGSVTPKSKKLSLEEYSDTPLEAAAGGSPIMSTVLGEKKPRPFLGLSFPDFFRGRYPSTSRASVNLEGGQSQVHVSDALEDRVDYSKPSMEEHEALSRRQYECIDHKPPEPEATSIPDTYTCSATECH